MSSFEKIGVIPELITALTDMEWHLPRDVQDESIPLILGGADVMIAAETGSGKTGAFCLPLIQLIHEAHQGSAQLPAAMQTAQATHALPWFANDADAGAGLRFCVSSADRDSAMAVAEDGFVCQARLKNAWAGARGTIGVNPEAKGLPRGLYFEATVTDEGLCRVGISTKRATRGKLGTDGCSFGFGGTGMKSGPGGESLFERYGHSFGQNDVVGCYYDLGTHEISFSKNSENFEVAFTVPVDKGLRSSAWFPAVLLKNAELKINMGASPWANANVKQGFVAWDSLAQPQTSIDMPESSSSSSSSSAPSSSSGGLPLCVIVEPTRDLALQVGQELEKFTKYLAEPRIKHVVLVGGQNPGRTLAQIPGCHVLVATPPILAQMVKNKKIRLQDAHYLVIDEADEMINNQQIKDVRVIREAMSADHVQGIVCSATLHSPEIQVGTSVIAYMYRCQYYMFYFHLSHINTQHVRAQQFADDVLSHPQWVDLKGKDSVPESVDHMVIRVDPVADRSWLAHQGTDAKQTHTDGIHEMQSVQAKADAASLSEDELSYGVKLLKQQYLLTVLDELKMDQGLIFCRTQVDCDQLEDFLVGSGGGHKKNVHNVKSDSGPSSRYSCVVLHGGRRQQERTANLGAFKEGYIRFLICTDVAARGIDIPRLPVVINYTLPDKPETYIHRVGRVGRADCA
jgi:ATP-dependent RNA helicase DDX1